MGRAYLALSVIREMPIGEDNHIVLQERRVLLLLLKAIIWHWRPDIYETSTIVSQAREVFNKLSDLTSDAWNQMGILTRGKKDT